MHFHYFCALLIVGNKPNKLEVMTPYKPEMREIALHLSPFKKIKFILGKVD